MVEDSSSLSLLNYDWGTANYTPDLIFPLCLDPLFSAIYVEIPLYLKDYLQNIKFTYKLNNSNFITIKNIKTNKVLFNLSVVNFENVESIDPFISKHIIILNKNKYKKQIQSQLNKLYKKFTESKLNNVTQLDYKIDNKYENKRNFLLSLQINHKLNYFFVDESLNLAKEIQNIMKFLLTESSNIVKTKTYATDSSQYLVNLINKIPGIGKKVSMSISDKYKTLFNFFESDLVNELENLIVEDIENKKSRKLGKAQANKIIKFLRSENPDEKL